MKRLVIVTLCLGMSYIFAAKSCSDIGLQSYSSTFIVNNKWNNFRNAHPNWGLNKLKTKFSQQECPNYLKNFKPPFYKSKTCLFMAPNSPGPIFHADNTHPAKILVVGCKIKLNKANAHIKKSIFKPVHDNGGKGVGKPAPMGKPAN